VWLGRNVLIGGAQVTIPGLTSWQPYSYGDESMLSSAYDLSGYGIAATDGDIGNVDEATYETGAS
jgi:hypothetical protein